jgi:hypothetical protein
MRKIKKILPVEFPDKEIFEPLIKMGRPYLKLGRICPHCNSMNVVRMGFNTSKVNGIRTQRFLCRNKECRKTFY